MKDCLAASVMYASAEVSDFRAEDKFQENETSLTVLKEDDWNTLRLINYSREKMHELNMCIEFDIILPNQTNEQYKSVETEVSLRNDNIENKDEVAQTELANQRLKQVNKASKVSPFVKQFFLSELNI